jgi:hypothetical protein
MAAWTNVVQARPLSVIEVGTSDLAPDHRIGAAQLDAMVRATHRKAAGRNDYELPLTRIGERDLPLAATRPHRTALGVAVNCPR